jgi:hypothetical protein
VNGKKLIQFGYLRLMYAFIVLTPTVLFLHLSQLLLEFRNCLPLDLDSEVDHLYTHLSQIRSKTGKEAITIERLSIGVRSTPQQTLGSGLLGLTAGCYRQPYKAQAGCPSTGRES